MKEPTAEQLHYSKKSNEADEKLKPLLTDEFLETLLKAAKTIGWSLDYIEVARFVDYIYEIAEKEFPDTTPYDYHTDGAG